MHSSQAGRLGPPVWPLPRFCCPVHTPGREVTGSCVILPLASPPAKVYLDREALWKGHRNPTNTVTEYTAFLGADVAQAGQGRTWTPVCILSSYPRRACEVTGWWGGCPRERLAAELLARKMRSTIWPCHTIS